ncbi:MAG: hypothetical protein ABFD44_04465 [Anaerolineaceae bacterium]
MIKRFFKRLELLFWDWITPRMSESAGVRRFVQQVYTLTHDASMSILFLSVLAAAIVGLLLGWIIGLLGVHIW